MAREPELSIKVKVDPQIKPTELKTSIERKVKQSGEKPQIDIDPNVDGIKRKIEDKLKNIKATANITPVVDTEKLKTDIQQQINGIGDIPKVTVGVNVDDFSDELSKRLKEELKSVNDKLSYYLKNLTTNTAGLNSVVEGLFPSRGISNAVQSELKSVQAELTAGLKGVKSKVKPFKETDLFQIGDTESTTTIRRVEKLVKNIRDQFASLDNFYDADEEKFLDGFNSEFEKIQNNASETVEKLSALKKNLSKDKFSDLLDNEDFDAESTTKALTPLISFLKKLSTTSIKTGEDYDNLYALFNNKNTNKQNNSLILLCSTDVFCTIVEVQICCTVDVHYQCAEQGRAHRHIDNNTINGVFAGDQFSENLRRKMQGCASCYDVFFSDHITVEWRMVCGCHGSKFLSNMR